MEEVCVCVRESLMWRLRGLSENLLEIVRSERQSLPGWTLDLEPSRLAGATAETDQEVQLSDVRALHSSKH